MDKKLIAKNSLIGMIEKIIIAIVTFTAIPIFIRILGSEAYGIFAIISVIGALDRFTNLGLNAALIRYISGQGRTQESHYDIVVALSLLLTILIPLTIALFLFHEFIILTIMKVPQDSYREARILFLFSAGANFLLFLGSPLTAVIESQKFMYIVSYLRILNRGLYWGLIIVFSLLGFGLSGVGIAIMISTVVWFAGTVIMMFRIWGPVSYQGIKRHYRIILRKQLSYSFKVYFSSLLVLILHPITKIFISNFFGVTNVGVFDIALRITRQVGGILRNALWPLFQLFSEIKDKSKTRMLVHDVEQKMYFLVIPLVSILFFITHPVIAIWIGENIEIITFSVISITGTHLLFTLTVHPQITYLTAWHPVRVVHIQMARAVINILVILAAHRFLGYYTVLLSYFMAFFLTFIYQLILQRKYLNSLIFDSLSQLFKLILSFCILLACGFVLYKSLNSHWIKILVIPPCLIVISAILYRLFRLITKEDVDRYFRKSGRLHRFVSLVFVR